MNFVNYTQGYDAFDCIPPSAQKTLSQNQKGKRDPNSYTGAAWIYGVHDRACSERPIFGKIRYMAASGLERKCDIQAYVKKADALVARA